MILQSGSFNIMVPLHGQKMAPGAYCTPVYMLSCIIWLQAVVEIITNETTKALNILVKQQTKIHNIIYQNHLALDYLLALEGGVCGSSIRVTAVYRLMMGKR
jgi:hypothetical protein